MKVIALLGMFCGVQASIFAADVFGLALHVEGEVLVTRGIMEFEAQVEEVLMWDDEIETGEDGVIQISFDSSFLSIGPNTYISFERDEGDDGEELMVMNLEEGSFRSKILNLGSRQFFEVRSDEGNLRVHGTDFVTSFNPESESGFNVSVLHGAVAVSPPEGDEDGAKASVDAAPVMLTQNQVGGVSAAGEAVPVADMSFSDADAIKNQLPIPGDADEGLIIADLGIENVEVESYVESVKEIQNESTVAPPESVAAEVESIQQEIIAIKEEVLGGSVGGGASGGSGSSVSVSITGGVGTGL